MVYFYTDALLRIVYFLIEAALVIRTIVSRDFVDVKLVLNLNCCTSLLKLNIYLTCLL